MELPAHTTSSLDYKIGKKVSVKCVLASGESKMVNCHIVEYTLQADSHTLNLDNTRTWVFNLPFVGGDILHSFSCNRDFQVAHLTMSATKTMTLLACNQKAGQEKPFSPDGCGIPIIACVVNDLTITIKCTESPKLTLKYFKSNGSSDQAILCTAPITFRLLPDDKLSHIFSSGRQKTVIIDSEEEKKCARLLLVV